MMTRVWNQKIKVANHWLVSSYKWVWMNAHWLARRTWARVRSCWVIAITQWKTSKCHYKAWGIPPRYRKTIKEYISVGVPDRWLCQRLWWWWWCQYGEFSINPKTNMLNMHLKLLWSNNKGFHCFPCTLKNIFPSKAEYTQKLGT